MQWGFPCYRKQILGETECQTGNWDCGLAASRTIEKVYRTGPRNGGMRMRAANFAGFPEEGNGFAVVGGCNAPECLQQDAIGDGMAALVVFEGRRGHAGRRQTNS